MITVNGWCAGGKVGGGGVGKRGGWVFSQWGRWGKTSVQTSSYRFLKTLTEGAVTTEAGSLFQYFTILTENADPLLRRRLAPWSTLKGCPLRPRRTTWSPWDPFSVDGIIWKCLTNRLSKPGDHYAVSGVAFRPSGEVDCSLSQKISKRESQKLPFWGRVKPSGKPTVEWTCQPNWKRLLSFVKTLWIHRLRVRF